MRNENISLKTNRILNLFSLFFILILIRVWFLSVIERDEQILLSHKPRRRLVIEKTERGSIRDRYQIPLAENKINYSVAVCYNDIKEIPSFTWETTADGKRVRVSKRKNYISELALLLSEMVDKSALEIEDIIYGKAAFLPHAFFVIKDGLSEEQYYKIKYLEKNYQGIRAQRESFRCYPQGKIACNVIGYMGSISDSEYKSLSSQIRELEDYIQRRDLGEFPFLPEGYHDPLQVRQKLAYLKERSYTLQDFIGKSGVEERFDKELRGVFGKKHLEVDPKGNILRTLPSSKKSSPARRVVLTLSSELQELAEKLLAERERDRSSHFTPIKGGAIIAMEPNTGEILALASYPRYNPQDFIPSSDPIEKTKRSFAVSKWLENESYLASIWDGERPLEKEVFETKRGFYTQSEKLTLKKYYELILSPQSGLSQAMGKINTLGEALRLQNAFYKLYELLNFKDPKEILQTFSEKSDHPEEALALYKELNPILSLCPSVQDKLLSIDLCHLLVPKEKWDESLIPLVEEVPLFTYFEDRQTVVCFKKELQSQAKQFFQDRIFPVWREKHFKDFLKQKRKEESEKKIPAKSYSEYLEKEEKRQFKKLWDKYNKEILSQQLGFKSHSPALFSVLFFKYLKEKKWRCVTDLTGLYQTLRLFEDKASMAYINSMRGFFDLEKPLLGKYPHVKNEQGKQQEKHLASAFYPINGVGYVRSHAFRQATPQGSIFKLLIAYSALKQRLDELNDSIKATSLHLNPLTLYDEVNWNTSDKKNLILGRTLDGKPITRFYKGGLLPKSHSYTIGKVDLIGALEQSSNIYFSILASEYLSSPSVLLENARQFNIGKKTGIELSGEFAGQLPEDITYNKSSLYAFAIGQHALLVTPLQTAVMLSAIANGGKILKPQIIQMIASKEVKKESSPFDEEGDFPFEEQLSLVGIHFPLFSEVSFTQRKPYVEKFEPCIKQQFYFPETIRNTILEGMEQVILGPKGTARASSLQNLCSSQKVYQNYVKLQHEIVGKTGTAEILVKPTIESEIPATIVNHTWFTGIAFENAFGHNQKWDNPELVVVVYLKEGTSGGKEGAPMVSEIVKKYRELKQKAKS